MNSKLLVKAYSLMLAVLMIFTVSGCGNKPTHSASSNNSSVTRPDATESSDNDSSVNTDSSDNSSGSNSNSNSSKSYNDAVNSGSKVSTVTTVTKDVKYDADKNPLKRGMNFSNFEMHNNIGYDNWIFQAKYYDMLREKGFDHVRLPVDFFDYMDLDNAPNYPIDEEALRMIDTIVNTALSAGLKIILDFHHFGVLQKEFTANRAKYLKLWEQLSIHYQNYPSGLIFEVFNEPGNPNTVKKAPDPINPTRIMLIQEEAIKIIRKTNPTRLIVHATKLNNAVSMLNETTLPDDENIIMSVHVYDPYVFTHQGTTWLGPEYSGKCAYSDEVRVEIEKAFAEISEYQEKTGRPVWIGEFGVTDKAEKQDRYKYAELVNELSKKYKVGWCWWEFSSGFGVYNIEKNAWTEDGVIEALTK